MRTQRLQGTVMADIDSGADRDATDLTTVGGKRKRSSPARLPRKRIQAEYLGIVGSDQQVFRIQRHHHRRPMHARIALSGMGASQVACPKCTVRCGMYRG